MAHSNLSMACPLFFFANVSGNASKEMDHVFPFITLVFCLFFLLNPQIPHGGSFATAPSRLAVRRLGRAPKAASGRFAQRHRQSHCDFPSQRSLSPETNPDAIRWDPGAVDSTLRTSLRILPFGGHPSPSLPAAQTYPQCLKPFPILLTELHGMHPERRWLTFHFKAQRAGQASLKRRA